VRFHVVRILLQAKLMKITVRDLEKGGKQRKLGSLEYRKERFNILLLLPKADT